MEHHQKPEKAKRRLDFRFFIERVIFSAIWFINGFLLLRILFHLLGANPDTPFIQWLYGISGIFTTPFDGVLPSVSIGERAMLDTASIVAIIMYFVGAIALVKVINLGKGTVKKR